MSDCVPIELLLAALLVTTFTCVGLLAIWAATSPRHWFARFAVVMAVLSPTLLIPAYELYLAPLFAIGLTCSALQLNRLRLERIKSQEAPKSIVQLLPRRISLASILLIVSALATLLAITVHVPDST